MPNPYGSNYPNQRPARPNFGGVAANNFQTPAPPAFPTPRRQSAILSALGQTSGMNETDAAAHMLRTMAPDSPMVRYHQDQGYQAGVDHMANAIASHKTMTDQPWGPHLAAAAATSPTNGILARMNQPAQPLGNTMVHNGPNPQRPGILDRMGAQPPGMPSLPYPQAAAAPAYPSLDDQRAAAGLPSPALPNRPASAVPPVAQALAPAAVGATPPRQSGVLSALGVNSPQPSAALGASPGRSGILDLLLGSGPRSQLGPVGAPSPTGSGILDALTGVRPPLRPAPNSGANPSQRSGILEALGGGQPTPPGPQIQPWMRPGAISTRLKADGTPMTHDEQLAAFRADRAAHPRTVTGRGNPIGAGGSGRSTILNALGYGGNQQAMFRQLALSDLVGQRQWARASDMLHAQAMQDQELGQTQANLDNVRAQTGHYEAQSELANSQSGRSGVFATPEQARNATLLKTGDPALASEAAAQHRVDQALAGAKNGVPLGLSPDDAQRALETQWPTTVAPLFRTKDGVPGEDDFRTIHQKLMHQSPEIVAAANDPNSLLAALIRQRVPQMYGTKLAGQLAIPTKPLFDSRSWPTGTQWLGVLKNIGDSVLFGDPSLHPINQYEQQQALNDWWNSINRRPPTR